MLTAKERCRFRVRNRILNGLGNKCRLSIFRSNRHFYAQVIDDKLSKTLLSASTLVKNRDTSIVRPSSYNNADAIKKLAEIMYLKILNAKIDRIVFDRGCYSYSGNIKIFIDTMRILGVTI